MNIHPLATEGIDTATFLVIVSAMASGIVGMAGLFYKRLLSENAELKQRLAGYEANAPELIATIEHWMTAYERSLSDSTTPGSSPVASTSSPSSQPTRSRKRSPQ